MGNPNPREQNADALENYFRSAAIEFVRAQEGEAVRFDARHGRHRAVVKTYSTGVVLVQGADSPLRSTLLHIKKTLESGNTIGGNPPMDVTDIGALLRRRVSGIDDTVVRLVEEAALCLGAGSSLGCAFLLGAASEKAILALIDTYGTALPPSPRDEFRRRMERSNIARQFDLFVQSMKASRNRPEGFAGHMDVERKLEILFHQVRMCRNEVGHPRIIPDLRAEAQKATLEIFDTYLQDVYALIAYYSTHSVLF